MSSIPAHLVFRLLPEQAELLLQVPNLVISTCVKYVRKILVSTYRTEIKDVVPRTGIINGRVIDMSQQPIRGKLHSPVACGCQSLKY